MSPLGSLKIKIIQNSDHQSVQSEAGKVSRNKTAL